MNNSIAVILPVYKNDKPDWLHKSIGSIINQTYKNYHLFIGVDGPVGDELLSVFKCYERLDEIDIVKFDVNRGLACVLNDLLDICFEKGYEYIARMDADDISLLDRFEKQISFLQVHPEIDVVGGAINEIDENGNDRGKVIVYPSGPEECYDFFAKRNPHAHPAVLFRKSFFDKAGCKFSPLVRECKLGQINSREELMRLPGVVAVQPSYMSGDVVSGRGTLKQILTRIYVLEDDYGKLFDSLARVYSSMRAVDECGNEIFMKFTDIDLMRKIYK